MEQQSFILGVENEEKIREPWASQEKNPLELNMSGMNLNNLNGFMAIEYDLQKEKNINFLPDYSKAILQYKINDEKIRKWQIENREILKKFGIESELLLSDQNENFDNLNSTDLNPQKAANPEDVINFYNL
jgi:hypothetical protein